MDEPEPLVLTSEMIPCENEQPSASSRGPGKGLASMKSPSLPGMNWNAVPGQYSAHELVRERLFFTLPRPLLEAIEGNVGKARFNAALLEMEYALAGQCGDQADYVGFWGGKPISYTMLRPASWSVSDKDLQALAVFAKRTPQHVQNCFDMGQRGLAWDASVSRGYLGWLLTSPTYLQEQEELFTKWKDQVWESGAPKLGLLVPKGTMLPGAQPVSDKAVQEFAKAFEAFFVRWRLNGLAAPHLPIPLAPQLSGTFPLSVLEQLNGAGGIFFIPDTYPVPSRDQFLQLLEDSLRGDKGSEHLTDWTRIVRRSNPAKSEITRYARIFELQHHWWILQQRHPQIFRGKIGKLEEALASFLKVEAQLIHRDLIHVRKRLGPAWVDRLSQPGH